MIDEHELMPRSKKPVSDQEKDAIEIEAQEDEDSLWDRWKRWAETIDR